MAFRTTTELDTALILKPQWAALLLSEADPKTWEIRGSNTKVRGRVGILPSGTSALDGEAELIGSVPLTKEMWEANMDKHKTQSWEQVAGRYKRPHVWVFTNGKKYNSPVVIQRKNGQVIWAKF